MPSFGSWVNANLEKIGHGGSVKVAALCGISPTAIYNYKSGGIEMPKSQALSDLEAAFRKLLGDAYAPMQDNSEPESSPVRIVALAMPTNLPRLENGDVLLRIRAADFNRMIA